MGYDITVRFASSQAKDEMAEFLQRNAATVQAICKAGRLHQDPTFHDAGALGYAPDHPHGLGMHCVVVSSAVGSLMSWVACKSSHRDKEGRPVVWFDKEPLPIDVDSRSPSAGIKVDVRGITVEKDLDLMERIAQRLQGFHAPKVRGLLAALDAAWEARARQGLSQSARLHSRAKA